MVVGMSKFKFLLFFITSLKATAAFAMYEQEGFDRREPRAYVQPQADKSEEERYRDALRAYVQQQADARAESWGRFLDPSIRKYLPRLIRTFSSDDDRNFVISRTSIDGKYVNDIHYNVYAPNDLTKIKGVVIKIYGAELKEDLQESALSEEHILANQGYLVYALNPRGIKGYGEEHLEALKKSHGRQSVIRDITYFAHLLKTNQSDSRHVKPAYSDNISPILPFFLTGGSLGGYMTLSHATSQEFDREKENKFHFYQEGSKYGLHHQDLFDGYIPISSLIDPFYDIKCGTTDGKIRVASYFTGYKKNSWKDSLFGERNPGRVKKDNEFFSPLAHVNKLEKPVLLVHDIVDDNTSLKQTTKFAKAAAQQGQGDLIGGSFSQGFGHYSPKIPADYPSYYEPILRFMDAVGFAKLRNQIFIFDQGQQNETSGLCEAATFKMRATHPKIYRPQAILLDEIAKDYLNRYDWTRLSDMGPDSKREHLSDIFNEFIEKHPQRFLRSILYLVRKDEFPTKGTFGEHTLSMIKKRKEGYAHDLWKWAISDIKMPLSSYFNAPLSIKVKSSGESFQETTTYGVDFIKYIGGGHYNAGLEAYRKAKNTLIDKFVSLMEVHPSYHDVFFQPQKQFGTTFY
jgi:hypothetical protein